MENIRGASFMVLAMAGFALEDALIKTLTDSIPVGQIIAIISGGATLVLLLWFAMRRIPLWQPEYIDPIVLLRTGADVMGAYLFVTALALLPLTTVSAVIQATPLVVAVGAAMFLNQSIGWRRWIAIAIGFIGVLIIIRPGTDSFTPATIIVIFGMLGLAARDLLTRGLKVQLTSTQLAIHAFALLTPIGAAFVFIQGQTFVRPDAQQTLILCATIITVLIAYLALVEATRFGNAGIISSFRYSRMIFALIMGYLFFAEIPDMATLVGATIIIASGLFTLLREAALRKTSTLT